MSGRDEMMDVMYHDIMNEFNRDPEDVANDGSGAYDVNGNWISPAMVIRMMDEAFKAGWDHAGGD